MFEQYYKKLKRKPGSEVRTVQTEIGESETVQAAQTEKDDFFWSSDDFGFITFMEFKRIRRQGTCGAASSS